MANDRALMTRPGYAITILRDADVQRVGALILSTLDRLDVPNQEFSRIVVYGRRVVVFELPWLPYRQACSLVADDHLGERLNQLIAPRLIVLRPAEQGCTLIIDL